ncbi:MAG: hypothetical protein ABI373_05460, partial [Flavobacteriales bacterium]
MEKQVKIIRSNLVLEDATFLFCFSGGEYQPDRCKEYFSAVVELDALIDSWDARNTYARWIWEVAVIYHQKAFSHMNPNDSFTIENI